MRPQTKVFPKRRLVCLVVVAAFLHLLVDAPEAAAIQDATTVRRSVALWLELHQNGDGSWGEGEGKALATAEAVEALCAVSLCNRPAVRRGTAWLLNARILSVDGLARAARAARRAGVTWTDAVRSLDTWSRIPEAGGGLGVAANESGNSLDSALGYAAIVVAGAGTGVTPTAALLQRALSGQRADGGWSGESVPVTVEAASDRTTSAEVVRALGEAGVSSGLTTAIQFLGTVVSGGPVSGAGVSPATSSLEIASRMIALQSVGSGTVNAQMRDELLASARFSDDVWLGGVLVNARGLLALSRNTTSTLSSCASDADCDGTVDSADAATFDPISTSDRDGDGISDARDLDRDGDGIANSEDRFPDDATEWRDADNDGQGDFDDLDDDNDGVSDIAEAEKGSRSNTGDSDGDGDPDASDPCPRIAFVFVPGGAHIGTDADLDGVCTPADQCPNYSSPTDFRDLDGDGLCDGTDADDDGDTYEDSDEIAWRTDPRDSGSTPANLLQGSADADRDGILNSTEVSLGLSPLRFDSDRDGFSDATELAQLGGGTSVAAALNASVVPAVPWAGAVSVSGPGLASPASPWLVGGATIEAAVSLGHSLSPAIFRSQDAPAPAVETAIGPLAGLYLGVDQDGDGLLGYQENSAGTNIWQADSDFDGFSDGASVIQVSAMPTGIDLDGDGLVDGEVTVGTSPVDSSNHPGQWGDTAPRGNPDGRVTLADHLILIRLVQNSVTTLSGLSTLKQYWLQKAADVSLDGVVNPADVLLMSRYMNPNDHGVTPPAASVDTDRDGQRDDVDDCPGLAGIPGDTDGDGRGDRCDYCPFLAETVQSDIDGDHVGDGCDEDRDGDYRVNLLDNCPSAYNPNQQDSNNNGVGDACGG